MRHSFKSPAKANTATIRVSHVVRLADSSGVGSVALRNNIGETGIIGSRAMSIGKEEGRHQAQGRKASSLKGPEVRKVTATVLDVLGPHVVSVFRNALKVGVLAIVAGIKGHVGQIKAVFREEDSENFRRVRKISIRAVLAIMSLVGILVN